MPLPSYSVAAVQPLKNNEDPLPVLRIYAYAIVFHGKLPAPCLLRFRADPHHRRNIWPAEADGVTDQVLE